MAADQVAGWRGDVRLTTAARPSPLQFEQMQQNRELMRGEEARKALVDFLPFLIKYHPIDKCRESFVELRALLADVWPEGAPEPTDFGSFERWRPCGDLVTWDTWGACRGSASDLRGFSCGFWQLLHGMTMGIGDDDAQPFVRAVGDFMMHLFGCHNCGEHFQKAALSPKSGALVQTGKDLVLWMWRIHNIVNNFTAPWSDPAFPKQQWPGPGLCWQCSKNGGRPDKDGRVQWIDDQVHLFLVDFYGYVLEGGQVRHISGSEGKQVSAFHALLRLAHVTVVSRSFPGPGRDRLFPAAALRRVLARWRRRHGARS